MPTILHRLNQWAETSPQAPAQKYKENGEWKTITAREFRDRVYYLALFLESRGIGPSDVGTVFSINCAEWVHMDMAYLLIGAKSAGIYPNSTAKDVLYVLDHTESKVFSVRGKQSFKKITGDDGKFNFPERISLIVVFDGDTSLSTNAVSYEAAVAEGKKLASVKSSKKMKDYLSKIDPKAPSIMIYTSGTTGNPKGALLSHDNLVFTSDLAIDYWKITGKGGEMFSFLPLCHVAEKLQTVGVGISGHFTVSYATSFENVSKELPEVQPNVLLCVPRLWEKMMEGVQNKLSRATGAKKVMADWALAVGARVAAAKYAGKTPNPLDVAQLVVANKLVIGKIRHALGLARATTVASGAAPLPAVVSRWFRSIGIEILEDFGQTESTGVICMTEPGVESAGTVGKPLPGTEFRLAEDGEILTKGRHVFVGYFKDKESTDKCLVGGWLATGDLAEVTPAGLIRIKGRKKEILKTSGGKMIAPAPIEELLKTGPMISQAVLVGDNRKYLSALFTLSEATLEDYKKRVGANGRIVTDESIVSAIGKHVEQVNRDLASYEQVKKFTVLANEFSIAEGEMTPTLKMKRNIIETHYRDVIDSMYT